MTQLRRVLQAALALVLVLSLLGPALQSAPQPLRAQRYLVLLAEERPEALVSVIVQKVQKGSDLESAVIRLGGRVTKDLHIINAFAAELAAGAALQLARLPGVRWVSLDSPVVETSTSSTTCPECVNTANLVGNYVSAVRATQLWNTSPYLQGQGIGVAVLDSGMNSHTDFGTRLVASTKFNSGTQYASDAYGHGTHVGGIVGGNGSRSSGQYIGVAPKVNLINVKVSDDNGAGSASDAVAGMQWILENKAKYNIRVVNISLNSAVAESYHKDPLCAAAEILWFNGIVVVVAAGNNGRNALYPPANDPFVITVGATNHYNTSSLSDDVVASFSGAGTTVDGFAKPDLVAPGTNLVAPLASANAVLARNYPANIVSIGSDKAYFRMSGTSMAAPVVAGAVALLLQDEPGLNPDQVKYRLTATAVRSTQAWPGYNANAGSGYLDIYAAVYGTTTESANMNTQASQLLWTGSEPVTWNSVNWNSVNWNSVNWNSVNWNSVNWNSVNWNSTTFTP